MEAMTVPQYAYEDGKLDGALHDEHMSDDRIRALARESFACQWGLPVDAEGEYVVHYVRGFKVTMPSLLAEAIEELESTLVTIQASHQRLKHAMTMLDDLERRPGEDEGTEGEEEQQG